MLRCVRCDSFVLAEIVLVLLSGHVLEHTGELSSGSALDLLLSALLIACVVLVAIVFVLHIFIYMRSRLREAQVTCLQCHRWGWLPDHGILSVPSDITSTL